LQKEKRRYRRYRLSLPMRFVVISGENRRRCTRFFRTRTWDIGLGGISFITPRLRLDGLHLFYDLIPTVRNQILIQIHLPDGGTPLTALGYAIRGQIVRVRQRRAYLVGIHFLQVSQAHGHRLRKFLEAVDRRLVGSAGGPRSVRERAASADPLVKEGIRS